MSQPFLFPGFAFAPSHGFVPLWMERILASGFDVALALVGVFNTNCG